MSEKKTILFNEALMNGGSKKARKNTTRKKKEKPTGIIKPSAVKKNLLEKIKKHQQESKIKKQPVNDEIKDNTEENTDFHNDFMSSLEYLNKLSNNDKKKKKKKNKSFKNPIGGGEKKIPNVTFNESSQLVAIDLPTDFNDQSSSSSNIIKISNINDNNHIQPSTSITNKPRSATPVSVIPDITNTSPEIKLSSSSTPLINPDAPYGVLKGGNKPTYREYHNKTLKKTSSSPQFHNRQQELKKLKKSYKKIKQKTRNTKKSTYKLGKKDKSISVFIKNNKTRRKIKKEHGLLKQKPLSEVKKYLYERNLLKIGSNAPNDVLRSLYEQSILAGEINNTNDNIKMHNFLNK